MSDKIKTKSFGVIEIKDKQIISFPEGIFGFDFVKKFVLLDTEDPTSPLKWLQAFSEPELAFVVIRPVDFMAEYELVIPQNDLETVQAEKVEDLIVFAIVTIPQNPAKMTANLQGPIIINPEKKVGKQTILLTDRYSIRHSILDELKKSSRGGGE